MNTDPLSILVIDDEIEILEALRTHLELSSFKVDIANHALTALEMMESKFYPIVLTDINMPDMNGLELLKMMKKRRNSGLVIMMTAYTSPGRCLEARYCGAFDYLLKPFANLSELDGVFERAIFMLDRWQEIYRKSGKNNSYSERLTTI